MTHSKLTSKGQTTLPASVRKALNLKSGDRILYEINGDSVTIRSHPGVMASFGVLKPSPAKEGVPFKVAREEALKQWADEAGSEGLR